MAEISKTKSIEALVAELGATLSPSVTFANLQITGVAYDSRKVVAGTAFCCIPGEHVDGNQFIADAMRQGAAIIITEEAPSDTSVPVMIVRDVRLALAIVAAHFYDKPSEQMRLIGVTGTNGKTTTTHLIERLFDDAGLKTGLIGTLGARTAINAEYSEAKHTTPQSADLQRVLADMRDDGCRYVSMEVSSHALAQKRVAGCTFAVAVLTNITQDHLDFHKTMEHYWRSKRLLFEGLRGTPESKRFAILNYDDPLFEQFADACDGSVTRLSYGWSSPADIHVRDVTYKSGGTHLQLATPSGDLDLRLKLAGRFNVYNVMAAIAVCLVEGIDAEVIKKSLEAFPGVSGRFEVVSTGASQEPLCIVDYAHTPDGLDNVLKAAHHVLPDGGRLIVVFGCGGDRDNSKRPQMGEIAEAIADEVVVTSDNPRSEDPQQIIANILVGIKRMKNVKVEPDRAAAIRAAVLAARPNDVVVIAGKGHENYQILADRTIPFDDRSEVLAALTERKASPTRGSGA